VKLLLVNVYPSQTIARYLTSSYVLQSYLRKTFSEDSLDIHIVNFNNQANIEKIVKKVRNYSPDIVGYSCYLWNIEKVFELQTSIKNKFRTIHLMGGPDISVKKIVEDTRFKEIDYFIIGEGEQVLKAFVEYQMDSINCQIPEGVATWNDGKLSYIPSKDRLSHLDDIPSIYLENTLEDNLYNKQQAFLETQRGCVFKCKYCVYHKDLPQISYYSLDRIKEELDLLICEKEIRALRILDAIFTSDIERAKEIVRHLLLLKETHSLSLPWIYWEFMYFNIDEEFLSLVSKLKDTSLIANSSRVVAEDRPQHYTQMLEGYRVINCIGIQSLNPNSMRAIQRPVVSVKNFTDFMGRVNHYNVVLKIDIILGLPHETFASYFEGLEKLIPLLQNTDHILNIHRLQILPGSDLEKECDALEVTYLDRAPYMVVKTPSFSGIEFKSAAQLTAILFRLLNSPLRPQFYETYTQGSLLSLLRNILDMLSAQPTFGNIHLLTDETITETYWDYDVFKEIPSHWLVEALSGAVA
jgi:hypothetical protein